GWCDARATSAQREGDGWRLRGRKARVYHAPFARWLLATARSGDGIGVFVVEREAAGVALRELRTIDGQRAADIEFDLVLPADARLDEGDAATAIDEALDRGLAALCADALGVLDRVLAATVQYARDRVQFGTPIGRF